MTIEYEPEPDDPTDAQISDHYGPSVQELDEYKERVYRTLK